MAKSRVDGDALVIYCPACGYLRIPVSGPNAWQWNGDTDKPTLTPSLLTRYSDREGKEMVSHSFLRDGRMEFLPDSTHEFAGQTVELVDLPAHEEPQP